MTLLAKSFNPLAVKNLMCRTTVSVGWDGTLYDCDFNQMLRLPLEKRVPQHISSFNEEDTPESSDNRRPALLRMYGRRRFKLSWVAGMSKESLLIIFTKNPEPGLVKTRLAGSIGDEKALAVYEILRRHTACIAEKVAVQRIVFYSHFLPANDIFITDKFNAFNYRWVTILASACGMRLSEDLKPDFAISCL
jgi:hypothetical protein